MELLFLLVERRGELVSRDEVADRLWGTTVFVDIDQSINTAVRKVRMVLRDDPDKPHFIETVVGKLRPPPAAEAGVRPEEPAQPQQEAVAP